MNEVFLKAMCKQGFGLQQLTGQSAYKQCYRLLDIYSCPMFNASPPKYLLTHIHTMERGTDESKFNEQRS